MTRRDFLWTAALSTATASGAPAPLILPLHRVLDRRAKCTPEQLRRFSSNIWPEAVRDFNRCGIQFRTSQATGEIRLSPSGRPIFIGLERGVINMVVTDHLPMHWDNGRALAGVTTIHEGHHLCVIALSYAHGHRVPFLSVNTCEHELLHALLQDIPVVKARTTSRAAGEMRI